MYREVCFISYDFLICYPGIQIPASTIKVSQIIDFLCNIVFFIVAVKINNVFETDNMKNEK
jgi:hypothetical protein